MGLTRAVHRTLHSLLATLLSAEEESQEAISALGARLRDVGPPDQTATTPSEDPGNIAKLKG
jgi:hypothetical protein